MAYTTINKHTAHFNTKLFTGNSSTNAITGVGHQPDLVWLKSRSGANDHQIYDSVRGATKYLRAESTDAEGTASTGLTSFDSDGFTVGSAGTTNNNGADMVSWNWKAGTTSIPSGSTTDPSAVSINTTAGFGIYKITAPSSGNYVLKHGLGATPKMVIVKRTDGNQKYMVWHHTFSNATNDYLQLNDNAAKASYATCWGTMNSTDCTIATGGTLDTGGVHIIYVFTDIKGYSKFGSYTGNGNADGTFVYTGFKPNWVMIKPIDVAQNWQIHDIKRDGYNPNNDNLSSNNTNTEADNKFIDILSNGFKNRTNGALNVSGDDYIYMAFGQTIVGSNNVPCTAR